MSKCSDRVTRGIASAALLASLALGASLSIAAPQKAETAPKPWAQIGRTATPDEIKAWDIDVRADFKGLPSGSGAVEKGMEIWEAKCASCHGVFGESTEVFTPIAGGTTKDDIKTGRVANLKRPDYPQRTTMMKVSQVSTLWDYINRAMPWNAPKSLKPDEVYAVLAYILNLAEVVPEGFVLSDKNIAQVQAKMPNRNGKLTYTEMWKVKGKPDVQGSDCMKNCATEMNIRSSLPDFARGSHGNLAEQNRAVGPTRGADTTTAPSKNPAALAEAAAAKAASAKVEVAKGTATKPPMQIAKDANCLACHATDRKLVGPSFREIAEKYKGDAKAQAQLENKVRVGGQGVWGSIPMPGNPQLSAEDLQSVVKWILGGAQ
jgi:cytochrome c551/c552